MDIEWLEKYCLSFQGTSHEVKWGNDLCFMVAGKMFCVAGLSQPLTISFKVPDSDFEELSAAEGFIPAPYMARAKWVLVKEPAKLHKKDLENFIRRSYELVKQKLPKKLKMELGLD
jgi:predicted DNA-binding protein (MmcQ/YjbR family)